VLFNTVRYAVFFVAVFTVSWLLVRAQRLRIVFLLLASYGFYACWNYRFLPLIFISSSADFLLARAIAGAEQPRRRKLWLWLTVILNLGLLGFFKYFNFGVDSMAALGKKMNFSSMKQAPNVTASAAKRKMRNNLTTGWPGRAKMCLRPFKKVPDTRRARNDERRRTLFGTSSEAFRSATP